MPKRLDLTGKRFGKLVATAPYAKTKKYGWKWLCQCDCGRQTIHRVDHLTSGHTRSCGCEKIKFGKTLVAQTLERRCCPHCGEVL